MVTFFGCGNVYINRRHDNHREHLCRYYVSRFGDLRDVIVPFFEQYPLRTAKRDNFAKFAKIIELMDRRRHLTVPGLIEIAEIAQTMNHRKLRSVQNPSDLEHDPQRMCPRRRRQLKSFDHV